MVWSSTGPGIAAPIIPRIASAKAAIVRLRQLYWITPPGASVSEVAGPFELLLITRMLPSPGAPVPVLCGLQPVSPVPSASFIRIFLPALST